jgi:hypothetical protein
MPPTISLDPIAFMIILSKWITKKSARCTCIQLLILLMKLKMINSIKKKTPFRSISRKSTRHVEIKYN